MRAIIDGLSVREYCLSGALLMAVVQIGVLVRERNAQTATPVPPLPGDTPAEREATELAAECDVLARTVARLQCDLGRLGDEKADLERQLAARMPPAEAVNPTAAYLQEKLLVAEARFEQAGRDIASMRKVIDTLTLKLASRGALAGGSVAADGDEPETDPKIDGLVLGVSERVNLVLISVGTKDQVRIGSTFTVYRGTEFVSKLVVDKVESEWAACREFEGFREGKVTQGDSVSTRVFE